MVPSRPAALVGESSHTDGTAVPNLDDSEHLADETADTYLAESGFVADIRV